MKFRVERDEFSDAVAWTARTLPTRSPSQLQVLAGLLLDASDGGVSLAAFDYEVAARSGVTAVVAEPGRALVSGRFLAELTRTLPSAPVEVATDGTRVVLTCGNARFTLPTMPVEDYPALPPLPPVTGHIEGSAFAAAVAQVHIAAGRDDTLPVLTGVRIEIEGERIVLAATDRYRLAVRELQWRPADPKAEAIALIPARTLADTAKSMSGSGVEIAIALGTGPAGESLAGFAGAGRTTTTRLVEGQFPPYRKLLPEVSPLTAEVEAVKRVQLAATRGQPVVRLTFTDSALKLEAGKGSGEAEAYETLTAVYDGEELSVAFNPQYLLDGLGAIESDTVRVGFSSDDPDESSRKPAILTGKATDTEEPDYRYLLMPVRLSG
jgi:DNA polymerase-3 subunit beta